MYPLCKPVDDDEDQIIVCILLIGRQVIPLESCQRWTGISRGCRSDVLSWQQALDNFSMPMWLVSSFLLILKNVREALVMHNSLKIFPAIKLILD